jgi:hypothetical protein
MDDMKKLLQYLNAATKEERAAMVTALTEDEQQALIGELEAQLNALRAEVKDQCELLPLWNEGSFLDALRRAYDEMVAKRTEKESLLAKLQASDVFSDPTVKLVVESLRAEVDLANEQIKRLLGKMSDDC